PVALRPASARARARTISCGGASRPLRAVAEEAPQLGRELPAAALEHQVDRAARASGAAHQLLDGEADVDPVPEEPDVGIVRCVPPRVEHPLPDLALAERVGRIVALAVVGLDPDAAAEGARPRARLPAHDLDVGVPHDAHDPAE